jgi:small subunit ribosomal protein S8
MSIQDPISDMLTRVRNAQAVGKKSVSLMASKIKIAIAQLLKEEGFIADCSVIDGDNVGKKVLILLLKYYQDKPVIESITRVSRPGLRIYKNKKKLPIVMSGMGIAIISTPNGLMTDNDARKNGVGGEIICYVK